MITGKPATILTKIFYLTDWNRNGARGSETGIFCNKWRPNQYITTLFPFQLIRMEITIPIAQHNFPVCCVLGPSLWHRIHVCVLIYQWDCRFGVNGKKPFHLAWKVSGISNPKFWLNRKYPWSPSNLVNRALNIKQTTASA